MLYPQTSRHLFGIVKSFCTNSFLMTKILSMNQRLIKCVSNVPVFEVQDLRKYGKHFAYIEVNRFRIAMNGEEVLGGS